MPSDYYKTQASKLLNGDSGIAIVILERHADSLADANYVECAWKLRGLVDAMSECSQGKYALDAGEYRAQYCVGAMAGESESLPAWLARVRIVAEALELSDRVE